VGHSLRQHLRSPDLARSRLLKQTVPWRVAFHTDRIQAGARALDREVDAERTAISRPRRAPSLRLEKILDRPREPVLFVMVVVGASVLLGDETLEQRPARLRKSVRNHSGVFEIALQIVARNARPATPGQKIRYLRYGHRGDDDDLLSGARHRDVQ